MISALPDWKGRIWFITVDGVVGWISPGSGAVHSQGPGREDRQLVRGRREGRRLHRHRRRALSPAGARTGEVREQWRREVPEHGRCEAGADAGRFGHDSDAARRREAGCDHGQRRPDERARLQARRRSRSSTRLVCKEPVFEAGASATDQSLIGAGRSLIAENNYGYSIAATQAGGTSDAWASAGDRSTGSWTTAAPCGAREEIAPSVVPKASCEDRPRLHVHEAARRRHRRSVVSDGARLRDGRDASGSASPARASASTTTTRPITIGPEGRIYLGVLGGLVAFFPGSG